VRLVSATVVESMLDAALAYAAEGLRVFPLAPRDKVPLIPKSEGGNGCHDGTSDAAQIRAWWGRWPDANVGVATGQGLLVVDLDGDEGCLALADLCGKHGSLPITRRVSTGRQGGFHFWFRAIGSGVRNSTGARNGLAPGIDTRGAGGYVVGAGTHPSGRRYIADELPIADAPEWLLALLTPRVFERTGPPVTGTISTTTSPYRRRAIELECEKVRTTPKGDRNEQLNASAFALGQLEAGGEIAYGDAGRALEEAAAAAGLPAGQSHKTIYTSGLVDGRENPRTAPERTKRTTARVAKPPAVAAAAVAQIVAEARARAEVGDKGGLDALISALCGEPLDHADTAAGARAAETLAQSALQQRHGDRLAQALRIISTEQAIAS
jgi:hypothetical protein